MTRQLLDKILALLAEEKEAQPYEKIAALKAAAHIFASETAAEQTGTNALRRGKKEGLDR